MASVKTFCRECGWRGLTGALIQVKYQVVTVAYGETTVSMYVCPNCGRADATTERACDGQDCWEPATMGTPTESGYQQTCWTHHP